MNFFYNAITAKLFFTLLMLNIFCLNAKAQNCFEITSLLVDACGAPEGENEMVRFDVGNAPLNIADLDITWPNTANSFNSICQDANTAAKVDTLNNGIGGCGLLMEPAGGILPANAKVLLVTSTSFNTAFNSFASLNDTLVIIFQCVGNTNGHFANNSSIPGLRTIIMSFTNPANCLDSVTYDRTLLVNQNGGIGGSSALNDGALVAFDAAGNATYLNYGCQALVTSLNTNAGNDVIVCNSGAVPITGIVTGTYTSLLWSGGTGSFAPPDSLITTYIPGGGETGWITLTLTATGQCGTTSADTMHVYIAPVNPAPILSATGFDLTCSLQSANLGYQWQLNGSNIGGTSYLLTATTTGCYRVIVTDANGCSVTSDTVCIINADINDLQVNFYTSLQPNPAKEIQHLQIKSLQIINALTLQLVDVTGQSIITKNYKVMHDYFETDIDLSAVAGGIYFLKLQVDDNLEMIKVVRE